MTSDTMFNAYDLVLILGTGLLMVVSAAGNITVLLMLLRKMKARKASRLDIILIHLAIADLWVTFVRMPIDILWTLTVLWLAGDLMCRAMMFASDFGMFLSCFMVICIAVDRYYAVLKPLKVSWEARLPRVLGGVWCGAILASLPESIIYRTQTEYEQCMLHGTLSPSQRLAIYIFDLSLLYILPLVVTVYCYCAVILEIIKQSNPTTDGMRRSGVGVLGRARARTLKMTITIVAVFFICWTPYFCLYLWWVIDYDSMLQANQVLTVALWLFACTNTCANPIVYGIFNRRRKNRTVSTPQINQSMGQSQQSIETSLELGDVIK